MPDNANPILKSSTPSQFTSLPSSSALTDHQQRRRTFLGRVQQASGAHEDPYYLDSVDLFDDQSDEDVRTGSPIKLPDQRSGSDDEEEEERIDSEEIFGKDHSL
jgi:hypothetical protein